MYFENARRETYSQVDLFCSKGRLGQKRYFVYSISIPLLSFWGIASIAAITKYLPIQSTVIFSGIMGIAMLAMIYMLIQLTIQRCHDFNASGWFAIFAVIPLANIIFAIIPGTNGINQYGNRVVPSGLFFKCIFYSLLLVLVIVFIYTLVNYRTSLLSLIPA